MELIKAVVTLEAAVTLEVVEDPAPVAQEDSLEDIKAADHLDGTHTIGVQETRQGVTRIQEDLHLHRHHLHHRHQEQEEQQQGVEDRATRPSSASRTTRSTRMWLISQPG